MLVAWGITTTGAPVLLHLAPGSSESTDSWAAFLDDMASRGLRPPLLVISDRAPGLNAAVAMKLSQSRWQSCLIHRCRNLLARSVASTSSSGGSSPAARRHRRPAHGQETKNGPSLATWRSSS